MLMARKHMRQCSTSLAKTTEEENRLGVAKDQRHRVHERWVRMKRCVRNLFFSDDGGTRVWTQDFILAKQVALYCLSHISSPFSLVSFWRWGLVNYLAKLVQSHNPPISAFQVGRITSMNHWCLAGFMS
jgi:hypothetical protein